jgi:hypothetical protein
VELLWDRAISQVLPDTPPKTIYLTTCSSISDLSNQIEPVSKYFGLFLAIDARGLDVSPISDLATQLLSRGLVYLCAWGPDCERVHDIFDEAIVGRELEATEQPEIFDGTVMTTWHSRESFKEAVWFFVHSAFATESYEHDCKDWVIATIGNPEWEQEVRRSIRSVVSNPSAG